MDGDTYRADPLFAVCRAARGRVSSLGIRHQCHCWVYPGFGQTDPLRGWCRVQQRKHLQEWRRVAAQGAELRPDQAQVVERCGAREPVGVGDALLEVLAGNDRLDGRLGVRSDALPTPLQTSGVLRPGDGAVSMDRQEAGRYHHAP